jgi:hypothetical protein
MTWQAWSTLLAVIVGLSLLEAWLVARVARKRFDNRLRSQVARGGDHWPPFDPPA